MKKLLILAALIAAPLPAFAEPAQAKRIEVSTAGLDLSNPADAAAMILRIEAAVRPVCVAPGLLNHRTTAGCMRTVMRDAVKNMRIPQVTFAFEHRSTPATTFAQG